MRIKLNVVSCTNTTLHEAIIEQGLDRIIFPVDLDKIRTVHELKWKICQFYEDKLNSIGSYKEVHTVKFTIVSLTYEGFNLVDEFEIKDLLKTDDELKFKLNAETNTKKVIKMVDLIEKSSYKPKIKVQNEKVTTFTDRSSDESSSESSSVSSDESSDESSKENLKQKTTQLRQVRQVQEPKFLNNKTQRAETILITKEKKPTVITKPQGIKTKPQENRLVKPDKKEEEELLPVKKYKPKEQTQSKYSKEKTQQITKQAFDKQLPDELNPEELKAFIQIPSGKLEDVRYLKDNFPDLFTIGTEIIFRVYEMTSSGAGVSKYKYGRIEEFSESSNSFLINLTKGNDDSLHMMYDINLDLICVPIKDFVELRIKVDSNQENKKETHREETTADVLVSSQPSTVDKSVITPFIKKQVEFYFSDKNYYKDSFLLEKAKQDGNKYIDLDIIMGFNKIRIMTSNKDIVREALKDSSLVEFDETGNKIRKKSLEFELNNQLP